MVELERGNDEAFWSALLAKLIDKGRRIPKFQVERAVGPILGFFLDQAISHLLGSKVVTLAAEFPLKKPGNRQSTNIDWLMYDQQKGELVLLELKTEPGSFRSEQFDTYLALANQEAPWTDMKKAFHSIRDASAYSRKYDYVAKQLEAVSATCAGIERAQVRVLYLAPKSAAESFRRALAEFTKEHPGSALGDRVEFRSFEDLRGSAHAAGEFDFARYRDILYDALLLLDKNDEDDAGGPPGVVGSNYRGLVPLDEALALCKGAEPVIVGFAGGERELQRQDVARLEERLYKWDWAGDAGKGTIGTKATGNWIDGATFVEIVEAVRSRRLRSEADVQRIAARIGDALRVNPDLKLGQLIERVSRDAALALDEMTDDDLVDALAARQ
ncbi:MAG: hypothetical protein GXC76_03330 [Rhodanobacteraceae bacterium]|jgi:hypothetical protein|nr:hypothetical protein [Rhodanobacteraceae bacterium]